MFYIIEPEPEDDHEKVIPEHENPVSHIFSEIYGIDYRPLRSFEEAKQYPDSYLIMTGDWGGQVYLSIPVNLVKCNEDTLETLLKDLDAISWECNEGDGVGLYYERKNPGDGIIGGMDGGCVSETLWVHDELIYLQDHIFDVLIGKRDSIKG